MKLEAAGEETQSTEEVLKAQIALPIPNSPAYDYKIPQEFSSKIKPGVRVQIPFRNKKIIGVVVSHDKGQSFKGLRDIIAVLDEEPILRECDLMLSQWMSEEYYCSWGEALNQLIPNYLLSKTSSVDFFNEKYKILEDSVSVSVAPSPHELTEEQSQVLDLVQREEGKPALIQGVTGSGKTEVYLRLIEKYLDRGKSSICLFPEIALSEQIKHTFIERFSSRLEILHSRLTPLEKFKAWLKIKSGKVQIVLGPRSALFAPFSNLGLIIIDEEQEFTYKQDQVPRYHTREAAKKLAELTGAQLVMGTATPSLETRYACDSGAVARAVLTKRVTDRTLPQVEIVDMSEEFQRKKRPVLFSDRLKEEIDKNLQEKQGTLIFLNRRGFSTFIHCLSCGTILSCGSCEVPLTFHMGDGKLLCHYCEFKCKVLLNCPDCGQPTLKYGGMGTEKLESEIAKVFPRAKIGRADSDIARKKGKVTQVLNDFKEGKIDILIGTQMIAKGFDFPQVTLVGVVLADVGLSLPDFRANEKTFQLLTQVAGRAGRGDVPGRVIIQTYQHDHHVIQNASRQDYEHFYSEEVERRKELSYPPFSNLVNIILKGKVEKRLLDFANELRFHFDQHNKDKESVVLGPAPLPIHKLRDYYRWHLMIKGTDKAKILQHIRETLAEIKKPSAIQLLVDVDPVSVL